MIQTNNDIYYFEGGFRRVIPYYFYYKVNVKGRWVGKTIEYVYLNEFNHMPINEINKQLQEGITYLIGKNGEKKVSELTTIIQEHDILCSRSHLHEPPIPFKEIKIIENTKEYLVIDKPSGIPIHPTGKFNQNCVISVLKNDYKINELKPVYRLDKNTSGVLVLAKTKEFASKFQLYLKEKSKLSNESNVKKMYLARVIGYFPDSIDVDLPLHLIQFGTERQNSISDDGVEARSSFKRIFYDEESDTSVVECIPHTGRTHQLRLHLKGIDHPIANDSVYLLDQIHNFRKQDGDIERERIWREKYGWKYDERCEDCKYPKGDPIEDHIWLHAWKYSFEEKEWITEIPNWAKEGFKAKKALKNWRKLIGVDY